MLKSRHRLKKQADFLRVLKEGKRYHDKSVAIAQLANFLGFPRFGVIVSKKVSKKAVVRNKIRRVILAILEPYQKLPLGEDIVITVTQLPDEQSSYYRYFEPIIKKWRAL
jgi:ribonuclease P protein component